DHLNGCSRAGSSRTWRSSASATASAATRCPTCTGSNEPPNSASIPSGSRGGCGRSRTEHGEPARSWIIALQVIARLFEFVGVADGAVDLREPEQGVDGAGGFGIAGDHVFEVDDGRIVGAALQIEHAVLVGLFGKLIFELPDVHLGAAGRVGAGEAARQLLVDRQRVLARRRIQL